MAVQTCRLVLRHQARWGLATFTLFLAAAAPAAAVDRTWVGGGGSWHTASNWNPPGVPSLDDNVTLAAAPLINQPAQAGSANIGAGLTIQSGGSLTLGVGTSIWTGGFIDIHDAGIITVNGTLDARGDGLQMRTGGAGGTPGPIRLDVPAGGLLTKTQGGGMVDLGLAADIDGSVAASTGMLLLRGGTGLTSSGDVLPSGTGIVSLSGMALAAGSEIVGSGTLRVGSGTTTVPAGATLDVGRLDFGSGSILDLGATGAADLLTGAGDRSGAGELTVSGPAKTTLNGMAFRDGRTTFAADVDITGSIYPGCSSTVRFEGTTRWLDGYIDTHDAGIVENAGTFKAIGGPLQHRLGGAGCTAGPMEFRNLAGGQFLSETSSTILIQPRFENAGTVDIPSGGLILGSYSSGAEQSGGTWSMHARPLTVSGVLDLTGGTFASGGTVTGSVDQTGGVLAPGASPGVMTVTGNLTQGPFATLQIEIAGTAPGAGHDVLDVQGAASLAGTLAIVSDPGFDPALTDTFTVVESAGALSGTFATLTGAALPGKRYLAQYAPGTPGTVTLALTPAPANTGTPSIPAAAVEGETVTCNPGTWTGSPTLTFQWLGNGSPVDGATGATYTLQAGDVGAAIVCRVHATNAGGTTVADSNTLVPSAKPGAPPPATPTATPTPTPSPTPDPPLTQKQIDALVSEVVGLPSPRRCVSRRNFRIRLVVPSRIELRSARVRVPRHDVRLRKRSGGWTVHVDGKLYKRLRGERPRAPVDLRGLPKGRWTVRITLVTTDGKTLASKRRYRTCAPKRRG